MTPPPASSPAAIRDDKDATIARLWAAITWALGENGEFPDEPPPLAGKYRQRFWWRSELRRRAFLVAEDAAAPPRWQPIETAPKEGTFMVYDATRPCQMVMDGAILAMSRHIHTPQHLSGQRWTHWMPLPAPPGLGAEHVSIHAATTGR